MISLLAFSRDKQIFRILLGYAFAILSIVGIILLTFNGLNKINSTVDDITNRLTEARTLSQAIDNKLQLVQFYADRYQRFYKQKDLDEYNEKLIDLKTYQQNISTLIDDGATLALVGRIQNETQKYTQGFREITKLIMYQQSLLSTTFIKTERLIEHQLSAIRINVGIVQIPEIYFSFGNAREAFSLMRLYQSKYLSGGDERYFVIFKRNYDLADNAFSALISALNKTEENSDDLVKNAIKAQKELAAYYLTFLDIHAASVELRKKTKYVERQESEIADVASLISLAIEEKYKNKNHLTQKLVRETKYQLISTVGITILISFILMFVVSRRVVAPVFDELKQLSNIDGLTKIANRRAFDARLEEEIYAAKKNNLPLSLLLCDVDYFKKYNDEYGHQMGDLCLQVIAGELKGCCKYSGDFVARYGGEEFVIILPDTTPENAIDVAKRINTSLESLKIEHNCSPISPYVTMSIGATTCSDNGYSSNDLIYQADQALYQAKEDNRNCVIFYSGAAK